MGPSNPWRRFFDYCPWLHRKLARLFGWSDPTYTAEVKDLLAELVTKIEVEYASQKYVPVKAAEDTASGQDMTVMDPFAYRVQERIRRRLEVEIRPESSSSRLTAIDKRSALVKSLVHAILCSREPIILLAEPGGGKTMTLNYAAHCLGVREQKKLFPRLVCFVPLGDFHVPADRSITHDEVWAHVVKKVQDIYPGMTATIPSLMRSLRDEGRLVIIFDGMDEMGRERYTEHTTALSAFANRFREIKCLFACRIADFPPGGQQQRFVLLPFNQNQIQQLVRHYFSSNVIPIDGKRWKVRQFAQKLYSESLPFDARNPFLIRLLCIYIDRTGKWPASKVDLMGHYVEYRLEDKKIPRELWDSYQASWAHLAYEITSPNREDAIELRNALNFMPPEAVEAGIKSGILEKSISSSKEFLRFRHHRFREYFTALHLDDPNAPAETDEQVSKRIESPRWQETLVNLVLLKGERSAQIKRILMDRLVNESPEKLPYFEESQLMDLVEMAVAIVRQQPDTDVHEQIRDLFKDRWEHSEATSQVRILEAIARVPEVGTDDIVEQGMDSPISWVREEASRLMTGSNQAARAFGTSITRDVFRKAATDELVRTLPRILKTAKSQGWKLLPVVVGCLFFFSLPVAGCLIVRSLLLDSYTTQRDQALAAIQDPKVAEKQREEAIQSALRYEIWPFSALGSPNFWDKAQIEQAKKDFQPKALEKVYLANKWVSVAQRSPLWMLAFVLSALGLWIARKERNINSYGVLMVLFCVYVPLGQGFLYSVSHGGSGNGYLGGMFNASFALASATGLALAPLLKVVSLLFLTVLDRNFSRSTWRLIWTSSLRQFAQVAGTCVGVVVGGAIVLFILGLILLTGQFIQNRFLGGVSLAFRYYLLGCIGLILYQIAAALFRRWAGQTAKLSDILLATLGLMGVGLIAACLFHFFSFDGIMQGFWICLYVVFGAWTIWVVYKNRRNYVKNFKKWRSRQNFRNPWAQSSASNLIYNLETLWQLGPSQFSQALRKMQSGRRDFVFRVMTIPESLDDKESCLDCLIEALKVIDPDSTPYWEFRSKLELAIRQERRGE